MQKDFKKWYMEKSEIEKVNRVFFYEREVWWCSLGVNVGFEQDGKGGKYARPILIFKKFSNEVFWAIPLTKNLKTGKFYSKITINDTEQAVILSQLRLIDAKRLLDRIEIIKEEEYFEIQKAIINLCSS